MKSFDEMRQKLSQLSQKKRVGVVAADDEHTLDAVVAAAKDRMVEPVLFGREENIRALLAEFDYPADKVEIQNIEAPEECAKQAARLVRQGRLDCIMKGRIETGVLMKVMVNKEHGIRVSDTMSVLGFLESPYYHKLFSITDGGLLMYPTLVQKKDMIHNAVKVYKALGIEQPKVAVLCAIEHVNPKMKETVEANQLRQMWQEGQFPGCVVEGPISYDLAMSPEAAKVKEYSSPVAGDADILVVPDIAVGNIYSKGLLYTGGAKMAGAVVGAMVPMIFTSRSASMEDKYMSILLNALIGKIT